MLFEKEAQQQEALKAIGELGDQPMSVKQEAMVAKYAPEQYKVMRDQAERTVPEDTRLPGVKGVVGSKEDAQKFKEYRAEVAPAVAGGKRILELTKDFNRVTDLKKKAEIQSELIALTGQLRVPLTGPGTMSPAEYERLLKAVGDPTSLGTLPTVERVKLNTIINKLEKDLNDRAQSIGLIVPKRSTMDEKD